MGEFQAPPPKGKPILSHDAHAIDEAHHAVALGIKAAADEMQQQLTAAIGTVDLITTTSMGSDWSGVNSSVTTLWRTSILLPFNCRFGKEGAQRRNFLRNETI